MLESNARYFEGPRHTLNWTCNRFRWARKLLGGKWERWWIDSPVCSSCWMAVKDWTEDPARQRPDVLARGRPEAREEFDG